MLARTQLVEHLIPAQMLPDLVRQLRRDGYPFQAHPHG